MKPAFPKILGAMAVALLGACLLQGAAIRRSVSQLDRRVTDLEDAVRASRMRVDSNRMSNGDSDGVNEARGEPPRAAPVSTPNDPSRLSEVVQQTLSQREARLQADRVKRWVENRAKWVSDDLKIPPSQRPGFEELTRTFFISVEELHARFGENVRTDALYQGQLQNLKDAFWASAAGGLSERQQDDLRSFLAKYVK